MHPFHQIVTPYKPSFAVQFYLTKRFVLVKEACKTLQSVKVMLNCLEEHMGVDCGLVTCSKPIMKRQNQIADHDAV